jgi:hypothetical protein
MIKGCEEGCFSFLLPNFRGFVVRLCCLIATTTSVTGLVACKAAAAAPAHNYRGNWARNLHRLCLEHIFSVL